jgi:hypothetical protein
MTNEAMQKIEMLLENSFLELEEAEHYGNRTLDKNLAKLGNEKAIQGRAERAKNLMGGLKERTGYRRRAADAALKGKITDMSRFTNEANKVNERLKGNPKTELDNVIDSLRKDPNNMFNMYFPELKNNKTI